MSKTTQTTLREDVWALIDKGYETSEILRVIAEIEREVDGLNYGKSLAIAEIVELAAVKVRAFE